MIAGIDTIRQTFVGKQPMVPTPSSTFDVIHHPSMVNNYESFLDISHELRTPLTAIQGAIELLDSGQLGNLSETGQRMLVIAARNVERLMRLTAAIEQHPETQASLLSRQELARLRLETELRSAILHQELRVYYQPIVALDTRQVVGFEALIRWQHPVLGEVSPTQFIPLAESTDLILEIGAWVLQEACRQLRSWQVQFPEIFTHLTIGVNLSTRQLAHNYLIQQIKTTLIDTGLDPHALKLEITEGAVMRNAAIAKEILGQLRHLGVQLSIDDFGTGYSSLSRLYELPLDTLKIDRSFVNQLQQGERGEYLVRAIANLAKNLGLDVIAEGVETEMQIAKLQRLGCTKAQGFYFSPPLPAEAIVSWLHQHLGNLPLAVGL